MSSADRIARVDAPLVRVVVYLHPAAVDQADQLARLRARTRSEILRDCVSWGLAREHAWRERNIVIAAHREQLRADDAQALERTRLRHPERFDTS